MDLDFVLNSIKFAIPLFCIATMFAIGLNSTFEDAFVAPLRNLLALAIVVLVNNVFIPIVGIITLILVGLLQLERVLSIVMTLGEPLESEPLEFGFLLLMLASGTLLGPTLATISGAKNAFAKGITVILIVVSAILLPLLLQLFASFELVTLPITSGKIFVTLLVYQLIPLLLGMIIKVQYEAIGERLRPLIMQLTGLAFLLLLALLLPVAFNGLRGLLLDIIVFSIIALIVAILTMIIGYYGGVAVRNVVKASNEDIPRSMATSTTTRNISFVLILLLIAFGGDDAKLTVSVTIVLLIYMINLIISSHQAVQWGKADAAAAKGSEPKQYCG